MMQAKDWENIGKLPALEPRQVVDKYLQLSKVPMIQALMNELVSAVKKGDAFRITECDQRLMRTLAVLPDVNTRQAQQISHYVITQTAVSATQGEPAKPPFQPFSQKELGAFKLRAVLNGLKGDKGRDTIHEIESAKRLLEIAISQSTIKNSARHPADPKVLEAKKRLETALKKTDLSDADRGMVVQQLIAKANEVKFSQHSL